MNLGGKTTKSFLLAHQQSQQATRPPHLNPVTIIPSEIRCRIDPAVGETSDTCLLRLANNFRSEIDIAVWRTNTRTKHPHHIPRAGPVKLRHLPQPLFQNPKLGSLSPGMQQSDRTRPLIRQIDRTTVGHIDPQHLTRLCRYQSIDVRHFCRASTTHFYDGISMDLFGTPPIVFSKYLTHPRMMMRPEAIKHLITIRIHVDTIDPMHEVCPKTRNPIQ